MINVQNKIHDNFTIKLLKQDGEKFYTFHIVFDEKTSLDFYNEIKNIFQRIDTDIKDNEPYTGENSYLKLVKIDVNELDIKLKLDSLIESIENPKRESNWLEFEKGYVLSTDKYYIIYLSRVVKILQTKFSSVFVLGRDNEFVKFENKLLKLSNQSQYDVIIDKNTKDVYLANFTAENLFGIESTFARKCNSSLNKILDSAIVTNFDNLKELSLMKRNSRYYINFKESRLKYIMDKQKMKQICTKFAINIKNNKIDTDDKISTNNFIKFLCNKGMVDPCDNSPVEVSNAKKWES